MILNALFERLKRPSKGDFKGRHSSAAGSGHSARKALPPQTLAPVLHTFAADAVRFAGAILEQRR